MNNIEIFALKSMRKIYSLCFDKETSNMSLWREKRENNIDVISDYISNLLLSDKPCMIARYGSFELNVIINYLGVKLQDKSLRNYIQGKSIQWWWNDRLLDCLENNAGVFPISHSLAIRFSEQMLKDSEELDVLGSWQKQEQKLDQYIPSHVFRVDRDNMNPFFATRPWTKALKNKNVVVIHPFSNTIIKQYHRKNNVFPNGLLPDFKLRVIPAIQSIGGGATGFANWFEALEWMKKELDKEPYDIVLIGCGAYGFPLAAHAKRTGHKSVHIGGSLQLYFGIKGRRWEGKGYVGGPNDYSKLFNQYWVRPSIEETPEASKQVENSCYW